jgi:hypothetical protein
VNHAKYQQLVAGQSSIAQKVLSVIPFQEDWDSRAIRTELLRQTRSAPDLRIVEGCLRALLDAGLIKAVGREHWRRASMPPAPTVAQAKPTIDQHEDVPVKEQPKTSASAFDRMATAAAELRAAAKHLNQVAGQFEEAALEAQQQIQEERKKSERFHQLKQLLAEDGQ